MAQLIQFPSKAVIEWQACLRAVKNYMSQEGASEEMMQDILLRMEAYSHTLATLGSQVVVNNEVTEEVNKIIDDLSEFIQQTVAHMMMRILLCEIEIWKLMHP